MCANCGCCAADLVFYFSENFPRNFTQGALLVAECLADYYRTGKLTVYEYTRESCEPVERRIRLFVVTEADLKLLLDELQSVQNPEHWLYRSWFKDETREEWLAHIQSVYQTLKEHTYFGVGAINLATKEVRVFEEHLGGFGLGDFYIDCDLRDRDGDKHRMNLLIFYCPMRYEKES